MLDVTIRKLSAGYEMEVDGVDETLLVKGLK